LLSRLLLILAAVSVMAIVQVTACPHDPGWLPLAARFASARSASRTRQT
jgi:hypothetical protein